MSSDNGIRMYSFHAMFNENQDGVVIAVGIYFLNGGWTASVDRMINIFFGC